jgi:anti-sigma factor RsiW
MMEKSMSSAERDMQCSAMADMLDLYLDGALSEEANARAERHLMRCTGCSFDMRGVEQARAHLRRALPRVESSPAFREKMVARLTDEFADMLRPEPVAAGCQRQLPFLLENL